MQGSGYDILIGKLDEFIRKYYKNQLIRGVIYSSGLILAFYLVAIVLEYFGRFDTGVRTGLFILLVAGVGYTLTRFVVIPLMRLNRFGKIISYEQASGIIGKHFTEVQDKLLNVLQLQRFSPSGSTNGLSAELLTASVEQKIGQLKPVPFAAAIDLGENRKYLKYAVIPFLLFLTLLFAAPSVITDPTNRIVNFTTHFEPEAPFKFEVQNELKTVQQEDFTMTVKLTGDEIPEQVFIEIGGNEYKLGKENIINFTYTFKNVQGNIPFRLLADGFRSKPYELVALPNPILLDFDVSLKYPSYLGKKDEVLKNSGDLIVPAGTKVSWSFNTQNTDILNLRFNDTLLALDPVGKDKYVYSKVFMHDATYAVRTENRSVIARDSVFYAINVIPDQYPQIEVDETRDSVSLKKVYFTGKVKDDYGFSRLAFRYAPLTEGEDGKIKPGKYETLPVSKTLIQDQFYYFWDLTLLDMKPGDEMEYYFEISDNDGVQGPKSTRSQRQIFKVPTLDEISEKTEKQNEEIKADLEKSLKDAKEIQKELDALNKKLLEKKNLSWEEKKKMDDLIEKQKELQKQVEEIKKQNQVNNEQKTDFLQPDEKLMEKQKELEKLFESLVNEDLKKKFEELQKLMEQMDKNEMQKQLDQMKLSNKDLEKELDRALEMFKQLQFEQKLEDNIKKLDELSKKQEELSNKTQEKNADQKDLEKKQEELNKEFDDLKKDLEEMKKMNEDLEKPNALQDTKQKEDQISQDQQNSKQDLNKNDKKGASKSQKKAAKGMSDLSQQLSSMQSSMESKQQEEDMNNLREILNNLIQLSFDQESLMKQFSKTSTTDPNYVKLAQQQKKLKDDAKVIEDSLLALSKRVFQLQSIVNKEISSINSNMDKSLDDFGERMTSSGMMRQQYVMTSLNNLALLLSEALNQMQQQMQNQMSGNGSCNKPGGKGSKPSPSQMKSLQQQLNEQIEAMKKALENGKKPGNKPGNGGMGPGGMSEQLVKLAAQQEALRKMLQQMMNEGGNTPGDMKNTLKKMEQTETDIVNKMITQETIKRQQEILSKLLDYEKAEKERETEKKRESQSPKNEDNRNQIDFLEYNKLKQKEAELLKTVPPTLKPYYKNKVTEYFNKFE